MNKILSAVIGGFLGVTMATAVGVGVSAGSAQEYKQALADSYTITFGSSNKNQQTISSSTRASTVITNGTTYVQTSPFSNVNGNIYYGSNDSSDCLKVGKSGNSASFTMALSSTGSVNATTIVVTCYNIGGNKNTGATISVNNLTAQTTTTTAAPYTFTINNEITSISIATSASVKVNSILVNYSTGEEDPEVIPDNVDKITANDYTSSGNAYALFSGVTKNTDATYFGVLAKNSGNMQFNNGTSKIDDVTYNRGLASSASGGYVKSVTVKYGNANSNSLVVRGSNTPYTNETINSGDSLGTLSASNLKVDILGSYQYVSITGGGGVTYPSALYIEWSDDAPVLENSYTDTITRHTTGIQNGSNRYAEWSNKKLTTSAIYAGKSAGSYNSIQINTNNYDSGVITTASGGVVAKVDINFSTSSSKSRVVELFGKSIAYSSPADLFSSDETTSGTLLGSVTYSSATEISIIPTERCAYIGIRSKSNAIYIESIVITWVNETAPVGVSSIAVTTNPTETTYAVGQSLNLTGMVVRQTLVGGTTEDTINYVTSPIDGYKFVAGDVGTKTITVTSRANEEATTTFTVTVVTSYPVSMTRTSPIAYAPGMKLSEGTGTFEVTLTDGNKVSNVRIGDQYTELFIGETSVSVNALADDYADQQATLKYTQYGKSASYTFKIVIEGDLLVDYFDDVPEYVLTGESATIRAHYTSFIGKPNVEVVALESENLSVSFDENNVTYDSTSHIGEIPFTVTGGSTAGQFSVQVTMSLNGEEATSTCSVIVRTAAPGHEGSGTYEKVTSVSGVTAGRYVIAANVDGTYLSMHSFNSHNSKFSASEITVSNNIVTSSSSSYEIFELETNSDGFSIKSGNNYVRYGGSSTNLTFEDRAYKWTIAETDSGLGTFRFTASTTASESTVRALGYHAPWKTSANNVFGPYSTSNFTTSAKSASHEYYEIELFKYVEPEGGEDTGATEFELVKTFVDTYMHMDDIAITTLDNGNACMGSNGLYATAKAGWNAMVSSYSGSHNLKQIFEDQFPDAYERYVTWAAKNGENETQAFNGQAFVPSNSQPTRVIDVNNNAMPAIIITISFVTVSTIAGYYLLKKKKQK